MSDLCCFHPIFETVVPVTIDLVTGHASRTVSFSKMDHENPFAVRYRCCRCERKIARTWGLAPIQAHPGEVSIIETTPEELRRGKCPALAQAET